MILEFHHANPRNAAEVIALRNSVRRRLFKPVCKNIALEKRKAAVAPFFEPERRPLWMRFGIQFDAHITAFIIHNLRAKQPLRKAILEIAEEIGQTYEILTNKSRKKRVVKWRQYAMWALKQRFPDASLNEIGAAFGGFDHTTVIHALTKIQAMVDTGKDPLA